MSMLLNKLLLLVYIFSSYFFKHMRQNLCSDNSSFWILFCCLQFQLTLLQSVFLSEFYTYANVSSFPWICVCKRLLPGCTQLGFGPTSASGLLSCQPVTTLNSFFLPFFCTNIVTWGYKLCEITDTFPSNQTVPKLQSSNLPSGPWFDSLRISGL